MREWVRFGMVDIRGERAHGCVGEERSCSKVGSMYLAHKFDCVRVVGRGSTHVMNLRAAPEPQGSFRGLSKVFPNRMSSVE
jgi:hypothetical protein